MENESLLTPSYYARSSTRSVMGANMVIHCHHYNARLQETVCAGLGEAGTAMVVQVAESVFAKQLARAFGAGDDPADKWKVAAKLYSYLGYGRLDFSRIDQGVVTADTSHFVEGYAAAFPKVREPICHLAAGYIQAAHLAATGDAVSVHEQVCTLSGASECRFIVDRTSARAEPERLERREVAPKLATRGDFVTSPNIDADKIIKTLAAAPFTGNEDGLTPAFGVYLANTPADFYNLLSIRFVEALEARYLGGAAAAQLVQVAEVCGMNTFRGIISSPEWDELVGPMLKVHDDTLFGIIAVSNALGWGRWDVTEYAPGQSLSLISRNGYEAAGYLALRPQAAHPSCWMFRGVAAGIMELVYGEGNISDRYGQFASAETTCVCSGADACRFVVEANS